MVKVLDIRVDNVSLAETLNSIEKAVKNDQKIQIVTLNPEMVMLAQNDRSFKEILDQSEMNIPDGIGLLVAAKLKGVSLKQRVTGADLIPKLCSLAEHNHWKVYLLGAGPKVAEKASKRLAASYPKAAFSYSSADPEQALTELKKWKGQVVLVAYGHGKQEKWIAENMREIEANVFIGVGGALDYISGAKKRAPKAWRQAGFEWLYRLISEPWRLRRQLVLPLFLLRVLFSAKVSK